MKKHQSIVLIAGLVAAAAYMFGAAAMSGDTDQVSIEKEISDSSPSTSGNAMNNSNYKKALFGAGCFWGVEATFRQINGVKATAVGYSGGDADNPTYRQVCNDNTGHAEVVQVIYDPAVISYDSLLNVFWNEHDPTQLNRQGPDVGAQYRSAVFYYDEEQKVAASASKEKLQSSGKYKRPVVTEISPALTFWVAEDYHQQYLEKRGLSTCRIK